MKNKILINKLKDNAELAMASYGYFDLVGKKFDDKRNKTKGTRSITLHDILDSTYKDYVTPEHTTLVNPEKLKGDFSPLQAQRFFSRYDLLIHQPNTESGFSATLFGEKRKQKNTESKEISYTSEYGYTNYTLAIRGTEMNSFKDLFVADASLTIGSIPRQQYDDMINFYETCASNYPQIKEKDSLTLTGHSLGGALAQLFVLCFTAAESASIIKALYTYNVSLESRSVA